MQINVQVLSLKALLLQKTASRTHDAIMPLLDVVSTRQDQVQRSEAVLH